MELAVMVHICNPSTLETEARFQVKASLGHTGRPYLRNPNHIDQIKPNCICEMPFSFVPALGRGHSSVVNSLPWVCSITDRQKPNHC